MGKIISKALLLSLLTVSVLSCKKDNETKPLENCNCGLITEDNNGTTNNQSWYTINVRNNCTDNTKTFYLSKGDWMNAHAGDSFCFSNEAEW
jgi:hypothetical protein